MPELDLIASLPAWSRPLASGLGAFLLTVALTPLVIRLARRMGWVAEPREDRWHERPTALMGGITIYCGTTAGWALSSGYGWPWGLWTASTILFLAGLADDLNDLSPVAKVVAQVTSATVLLVAGWELAPGWPAWLSVPLTYLWVIGITNAVNLLDNMDGLAAGIVGIAAATVALLAVVAGTWQTAGPALAVAGAAGGFLVHNFQPARIFMGDSGALFLGVSVSALALWNPGAGASGTAAVLAVPAAIMAVPILDTTLVTLRRISAAQSVTQGGKDHSSHRLVFLGLSERRAVVTLYVVATAFSILAIGLRVFDVYLTLAMAGMGAVALAVFGGFLGEVRVEVGREGEPRPRPSSPGNAVLLRSVLREKRKIAVLLADLLLIVGSFVVAHFLRYEDGLSDVHADRLVRFLPIVVLVKIGILHAYGAYRGLLRYAGSHELLRVGKASTVASGVLLVGLIVVTRFEGYSRSVFIIDWLVTSLSLAAMRGAFRGLRGYFAAKRRGDSGTRVLLYGAGDAGSLAVREIRQNPELMLTPVGFVDDDPKKQGRRVSGLPVLGGQEELQRIVREENVDVVVVTISRIGADGREALKERCRSKGLRCREMRIEFEE